MQTFKGHIIIPGTAAASAVVTHRELNLFAAYQRGVSSVCGDRDNPELFGKKLAGKALCLPKSIGFTDGGLMLYCACTRKRQPACMLFSDKIDAVSAGSAVLASLWLGGVNMPVIDCLGEEFLSYVANGMSVTVRQDGMVIVK